MKLGEERISWIKHKKYKLENIDKLDYVKNLNLSMRSQHKQMLTQGKHGTLIETYKTNKGLVFKIFKEYLKPISKEQTYLLFQ